MGLIESALARLKQPEAVRLQFLAHLFLARIHNVVKSSYDRFQQTASKSQAHHDDDEQTADPVTWLEENYLHHVNDLTSRQPEASLGVLVHRKRRNNLQVRKDTTNLSRGENFKVSVEEPTGRSHRDYLWDWHGFPALWRPLGLYDLASTSWMIWASLRALLCDQLAALVSPVSHRLFGLPGNCLLLGRLATPVAVSHLSSVVLASFHLSWRLAQERAKRNRLITVIVFLLASERDLDHAYQLLDPPDQSDRHQEDNQDELHLFRHVMCYRVHRDQRVHFKLRPNRTRAARDKLRDRTALVTLISLAFFGVLFLVALILILLAILSDYRYVHVYPGCYPLLDELLARGQLSFFSITPLNHHLLSVPFDGLENLFLWLDSGLSLTFVPAFTYLLNYDLLLYWSALNRKLHMLAERSKWSYIIRQVCNTAIADDNGGVRLMVESPELPISRTSSQSCARQQMTNSSRFQCLRTLEADIHELQFEMFDFFHQVREIDLFVGDVLTAAILTWLAGCGFVTYNQLTFNDTSMTSLLVELVLMLSFCVISLATYHLLELRRRCLRSYHVMCSLIAYDQTRKKRHFTKLMDFYLHNSTSYHLCRTYAYKPTTFITIIGWTFSCFFIAFTLFKPAQQHTQVSGTGGGGGGGVATA